MGVLWTIPS
ncbi:rCG63654, partial [Rattus norvegicus]